MTEGKMSTRQLTLILITKRVAALLVLLPVVAVGEAHQDAWISVIIGTSTSILIGLMTSSLAKRTPNKSFGHVANEALGRVAGTICTAFLALSLYIIGLARTRMVSLVVITQFMPQTPGWGLAVPLLLVAFYGAILGPDTVGRASELVFTVITAIVAGGILLAYISDAAPATGLKPIMANGVRPVLVAAIPAAFLGAVSSSTVLALGRFTTRTQGIAKAVVTALVVSGTFLLLITILVLTTLGPHQAENSVTPLLTLASTIYIEGVIERADLPLMAAWVLGVTFDVTVLLLSASILIGDSLGVSFRTVCIVLFLAGVVPVSHRFTDVFSMSKMHAPTLTGVWTAAFAGVVGLVYGVSLAKDRRNDGQ